MKSLHLTILIVFIILPYSINAQTELEKAINLNLDYDEVFSLNGGLARVRKGAFYGFIDKKGKIVIPCVWEFALDFSEGLAGVKLNEKWGYIDKTGKIIISLHWKRVQSFKGRHGLVLENRNRSKWKFINKSGEIIKTISSRYMKRSSSNYVFIRNIDKENWKLVEIKTGKVIRTSRLIHVYPFSEDLAVVVEKNKKWGVIGFDGKYRLPPIYEQISSFSNGLAPVKKSGKWGVIDKKGTPIAEFLWDEMKSYSNGIAAAKRGDFWWFINKKGKKVSNKDWKYVKSFSQGFAVVSNYYNRRRGLINKKGKVVLPLEYD